MRTKHIFYSLVATALLVSCQRKNEFIADPAAPVAGKGGLTKLMVTAQHYQKDVDTGTIYIKYNSTMMPMDMKFDDSGNIKMQNGRPMVVFDSLKRGNYFFYVKGRSIGLYPPKDSLFGEAKFIIIDTIQQEQKVFISLQNLHDVNNVPKI
ncbi:hypothetical protein CAP35_15505 [Chitinophagaceae bacterium IBVUCB1]|nr:hypothetical protein CAP35_15505 [Chitinophagaceae bacterium IBVUCB1]